MHVKKQAYANGTKVLSLVARPELNRHIVVVL